MLTLSLFMFSCTEEITINTEEGDPLIGVSASFTDEFKRHEAVLSYSSDFYNTGTPNMISGAKVAVTDGVDTIPYIEQEGNPGHYLTDFVAGRKNTLYRLLIDIPDAAEADGYKHLYAESYMNDNIEGIDSLQMHAFNSFIPMIGLDSLTCVYPYFQSLDDKSIIYMVSVSKNDTLVNDTLTKMLTIPMAGYAGYYVNGPEFLEKNMEIPVWYFPKGSLRDGDRIKVFLNSIPSDFMYYIYELSMSTGSNPMMGSPTNILTNVKPAGEGVGWFYAASVVTSETVWHE